MTYLKCPKCQSKEIFIDNTSHVGNEEIYYSLSCGNCGWSGSFMRSRANNYLFLEEKESKEEKKEEK